MRKGRLFTFEMKKSVKTIEVSKIFSKSGGAILYKKNNINDIILKINKCAAKLQTDGFCEVWRDYKKVDEKRLKSNLPKARNTRLVFSSLLFLTLLSFSLFHSGKSASKESVSMSEQQEFVNCFDLNGKRSKHRKETKYR